MIGMSVIIAMMMAMSYAICWSVVQSSGMVSIQSMVKCMSQTVSQSQGCQRSYSFVLSAVSNSMTDCVDCSHAEHQQKSTGQLDHFGTNSKGTLSKDHELTGLMSVKQLMVLSWLFKGFIVKGNSRIICFNFAARCKKFPHELDWANGASSTKHAPNCRSILVGGFMLQ